MNVKIFQWTSRPLKRKEVCYAKSENLVTENMIILCKKSLLRYILSMRKTTRNNRKGPSFERSFANHPRSSCWNYQKNAPNTPRDVFIRSGKNFWFTCETCNHDFSAVLSNVTSKNSPWCPYCSNQKRCNDEDCMLCFEKSFANHPRSGCWNYQKKRTGYPKRCFYKFG